MIRVANERLCERCGKPLLLSRQKRFCSQLCCEAGSNRGPTSETEVWQRAEEIRRGWSEEERQRRQVGRREWFPQTCRIMAGDDSNDER